MGIRSHRHDDAGVWQELRRRRVTRVVVTYFAVSFAVYEGVSLLLPVPGVLPAWTERAVLGVLALGFPLALVLAWTYDLTRQGIVRTPVDPWGEGEGAPKRTRWVALAALGLGLLFHVLQR